MGCAPGSRSLTNHPPSSPPWSCLGFSTLQAPLSRGAFLVWHLLVCCRSKATRLPGRLAPYGQGPVRERPLTGDFFRSSGQRKFFASAPHEGVPSENPIGLGIFQFTTQERILAAPRPFLRFAVDRKAFLVRIGSFLGLTPWVL